jgi:exopolyphosphatase/guanosine-5'-triphosphate,3'-diphosphate pyrophosphatase
VDPAAVRLLRKKIRADLADDAGSVLRMAPDHAVATSKTFRSLARICGAAPSGDGPHVRRVLDGDALREVLPRLLEMTPEEVAVLPGVSPSRRTRSSRARWSPRPSSTCSACRSWRSARGRCARA